MLVSCFRPLFSLCRLEVLALWCFAGIRLADSV